MGVVVGVKGQWRIRIGEPGEGRVFETEGGGGRYFEARLRFACSMLIGIAACSRRSRLQIILFWSPT
jgi:hypothetical protein